MNLWCGETKNAYIILNPLGYVHLKVEKRDGRVTLKWLLRTQILRMGSEWN
jgi:hypothetical protein